MRILEGATHSGEHAQPARPCAGLGRRFRRLVETNLFSKFAKARRFRPRPRRMCSPEMAPRYHVVCLTRAVLTVTLSIAVFASIAELRAKETTAANASPTPTADGSPAPKSPIDQLIPWLLDEQKELRGIAFSEVIFDTTGKRVLPIDSKNEQDARVIKQISAALDETVKRLNAADNPVQQAARINEVSSHVEDTLRELLNVTPGLSCDFPHTAADKVQRSGYPDLRIVDTVSQRVFYLDPKLYAAGSRDSSFRTFYFEAKIATNKVRDDAVHLIAGLEHAAKQDGQWRFTRWDLVDLSHFRVKLKAEFQGSNKDMYRPDAIIASSAQQREVAAPSSDSH